MPKFCPDCGKSVDEVSKFCNHCGAKLDSIGMVEQKEPIQAIQEEKSPFLATLCSFFIPGLGQVYDGETARGVAIFIGTLIGLFIFLIPGLIVWIFGMYNAYTTAKKMNNKEIPFKPTKTAHLLLFIILAVFLVGLVVFVILMAILSSFAATLPHTTTFPTR